MYGTEYKHTGTVFSVNMCKFVTSNTFGIGKSINNGKTGNLGVCELKPVRKCSIIKKSNYTFFNLYLEKVLFT